MMSLPALPSLLPHSLSPALFSPPPSSPFSFSSSSSMLRHRSSRNSTPVTSPVPDARHLTGPSPPLQSLPPPSDASPALSSAEKRLPALPPLSGADVSPFVSSPPSPLCSPRGLDRSSTTSALLPSVSLVPVPSSPSSPSSVRSVAWQVLRMGWPSAMANVMQQLVQVSSTLFLGRVSATALGAAAIGSMTCNLTGFSVGLGFTTCLDALCSQAYGGRQYRLCGLHAQKGLVMLTVACVPVAAVWSQTRVLVGWMGVDDETAAMAQAWADHLQWGMWPFFAFEAVRRWLQAQRVVWPVVAASAATIAWNLTMNTLVVYRWKWGFQGPALVMAASYWVMFLVLAACAWGRQRWIRAQLKAQGGEEQSAAAREAQLAADTATKLKSGPHSLVEGGEGVDGTDEEGSGHDVSGTQGWGSAFSRRAQYVKVNSTTTTSSASSVEVVECLHDCWPPLSWEVFSDWSEHLRLGLPGAASLFLEWGSYEVSASFAARLGAVPLATHSIYMSTVSLWYTLPLGLSNATAAIIGNQLGAGEARLASITARVAMALCLTWGLLNGAIFVLGLRTIWGTLFVEDETVRTTVADSLWVLFYYGLFDSIKCVLMAVLRGCGRPLVTVYGNILSCWLVGYPMASLLCFHWDFGLVGLWTAMTAAWFTATAVYSLVLYRTDWAEECRKANARNERQPLSPSSEAAPRADAALTAGEVEMDDLRSDELVQGTKADTFPWGESKCQEEGGEGEKGTGLDTEEGDSTDCSAVEDSEVEAVVRRVSHRDDRTTTSGQAVEVS